MKFGIWNPPIITAGRSELKYEMYILLKRTDKQIGRAVKRGNIINSELLHWER